MKNRLLLGSIFLMFEKPQFLSIRKKDLPVGENSDENVQKKGDFSWFFFQNSILLYSEV